VPPVVDGVTVLDGVVVDGVAVVVALPGAVVVAGVVVVPVVEVVPLADVPWTRAEAGTGNRGAALAWLTPARWLREVAALGLPAARAGAFTAASRAAVHMHAQAMPRARSWQLLGSTFDCTSRMLVAEQNVLERRERLPEHRIG
jgi:hypothetical protein